MSKPRLSKHSEVVAEVRKYFENTARQARSFGDWKHAFDTLEAVTVDMLKRTERRLIEAETGKEPS